LYVLYFSFVCRTDPKDVARVESKTFLVTDDRYTSESHVKQGVKPIMGNWMPMEQFETELEDRFPGCMAGETMHLATDYFPHN